MSESHHSARLKRDHLRKKSTDAAERFEYEYVRTIEEDASPMHAFHIANLRVREEIAKKKLDTGDGQGPDKTEETIDVYRQQHRAWRENAGLPLERETDDMSDATELPSIEQLSEATDSAVN